MPLAGYDLSHDQPVPALAGVSFVINRGAFGNTPDIGYVARTAAVNAAGKLAGTYLFLMGPERNATLSSQIAYFAAVCRTPHFTALDLEHDIYRGHNYGRLSVSALIDAIDLARGHGLNPGVYADFELWTPAFVQLLKNHRVPFLWVPNYVGYDIRVTHSYIFTAGVPVIWQWTSSGTPSRDVDLNRAYMTLPELNAIAGLAPTPPAGVHLYRDPRTGAVIGRLKYRGLYRVGRGHAAHVDARPVLPEAGHILTTIPAGHLVPYRVAQTIIVGGEPVWLGNAAGTHWVQRRYAAPVR